MRPVTLSDVEAAYRRIRPYVRETPVLEVDFIEAGVLPKVKLKLEGFQIAGSFKIRGILNCILAAIEQDRQPRNGIVVASIGNAGIAAAHVAQQLGLTATVFLPTFVDPYKVSSIAGRGAQAITVGDTFAATDRAATRYAIEQDCMFLNHFEQRDVIAGYGTVALELMEQTDKPIDTVLVPVGGGGLLAGTLAVATPHMRIIAVEPAYASLGAATAQGAPVEVPVYGRAKTSLGVGFVGVPGLAAANSPQVQIVSVSEDTILGSFRLIRRNNIIAEHGATLGLAALLTAPVRRKSDDTVAVIITGANINPSQANQSW